MNEQVIRDLMRRVEALERTRPRLRVGEVTGVGPLDVALGGASTSYQDVSSLGGVNLAVNDKVAVLVSGNDLLVLGAVNGERIVHGVVAASGAITAGDGFTSVKNSTGNYTVTFDVAFTGIIPTIAFGMGRTAVILQARVVTVSNSSFTYATYTTAAGANTDSEMNFIAIGPA